ncbi:hypothetical protein A9R01_11610 ['Osedax' symbiont bacterium Rs2_46_30_T18]|nr:hypothetical protein A9R01_11610 ['Osedax' symbiont bacterium Rs2_46_30_T18]
MAIKLCTFTLLATTAVFSSAIAMADVPTETTQFFTQLYAKTCLSNAANMDNLRERFALGEVPELSRAKAEFFLQGKVGTVWVIPNTIGNFLVSIDRDNTCTVYAQRVKINEIERAFSNLLEEVPTGFESVKEQDETRQTTLGPMHFISYTRTNLEDNGRQKFSLSTSTANAVKVQAKAVVEALVY